MNTPYCVITDAGREIMRGVNISGNTVKSDPFVFTKIMLGCGTYTEEQKTESALKVMTALRTPKNNYTISSVKRVNASNNLYKVSAIATNYNVATGTILVANGYNVTEIGIYARPSGGSEALAAIAVIDEPDYMPYVDIEEAIEGQIYQIVYDLYFGYSNVELDATIQSSGAAYPATDGETLEKLIGEGAGAKAVIINTQGGNTADGDYSTAMGAGTAANGTASSAMGNGTVANGVSQSVRGRYNVEDDGNITPHGGRYADIVGNGTSDSNRSNAYALTWDGDAEYQLGPSEALYTALASVQKQSEVVSGGMMSLKSMLHVLLQGLTAQTASGTKNNSVTAAGTCGLIKIGNIVICNFRLTYSSGANTIPASTTLYTIPAGYRPLSNASCNVTVIRGTSAAAFGGAVTVDTDGLITHSHGEGVTSLNGTLVWISNM